MPDEDIKARVDKAVAEAKAEYLVVKNGPPWKIYTIGVILLFIIGYLAWCLWGTVQQKPSENFVKTKPAVEVPKVDGPILKVPLKIVPKKAVEKKFPEAKIKDSEEWLDTAKVPKAPHGGTMLTKIDTVTGETSNEFKTNSSPWFEFQRKNTVEIFGVASTDGNKIEGNLVRDIVSIKDATIAVKAGTNIPLDPGKKLEVHFGVGVKWEFDFM